MQPQLTKISFDVKLYLYIVELTIKCFDSIINNLAVNYLELSSAIGLQKLQIQMLIM